MATQDIPAIVAAALAGNALSAPQGFIAAKTYGRTASGSFLAHPADRGTGTKVLGYDPDIVDEQQDLGIEIAVADDGATVASTGALEDAALAAINLLSGYHAERHAEGVQIATDTATTFDPDDVAAIIEQWLARKHQLHSFAVRVIFGPPGGRSVVLRDLRGQAYAIHKERAMSDQ